jgi:serine protease Do
MRAPAHDGFGLRGSPPGLLLQLLLGLSLLACWAAARASQDFELFRKLTPSVLKVEAANGDGSVSIGSGVVVGRGVVATNCHVTQRAVSIALVKGGERRDVDSQFSDIDHDLCLLHSALMEDEPIVAIDSVEPQVGQPVFSVGFVYGIAPRLSSGEIDAVYEYDGGRVIETSAAFALGASGGGLFDAQGHLVGLVSFMSRGGQVRHFCLPASWVARALAHFDGQPVAPLSGMPFWQLPAEAQPYFLRAATLEAEQDWMRMREVARQWSFDESANASSWFALATAYAHLNQTPESIDAYQAAVDLDAGFAPAWYGLGLAYADSCRPVDLARVRMVLTALDARMANGLARHEGACRAGQNVPPGG